jgi:hypothetical protein
MANTDESARYLITLEACDQGVCQLGAARFGTRMETMIMETAAEAITEVMMQPHALSAH